MNQKSLDLLMLIWKSYTKLIADRKRAEAHFECGQFKDSRQIALEVRALVEELLSRIDVADREYECTNMPAIKACQEQLGFLLDDVNDSISRFTLMDDLQHHRVYKSLGGSC